MAFSIRQNILSLDSFFGPLILCWLFRAIEEKQSACHYRRYNQHSNTLSAIPVPSLNVTFSFCDCFPADVKLSKKRQPFVPYALRNHTGCTMWFATLTTTPTRSVSIYTVTVNLTVEMEPNGF